MDKVLLARDGITQMVVLDGSRKADDRLAELSFAGYAEVKREKYTDPATANIDAIVAEKLAEAQAGMDALVAENVAAALAAVAKPEGKSEDKPEDKKDVKPAGDGKPAGK
jgi:hypothetical protein